MCTNSMKNILVFVKFGDFFPKWKGRKYSSVMKITLFLPWLLPSIDEICQPWHWYIRCEPLLFLLNFFLQNLEQWKSSENLKKHGNCDHLQHILVYRLHSWYNKSKRVLYVGPTKREGNIWHNLGGNTIILFFNINNEQ